MRTNRVREQRNKSKRSRLRTAIKNAQSAEGAETVAASFQSAKSLIDRAAAGRLIHRNKAARLKSQLAKLARSKGVEAV
jgi:small subunit ribosomal protein S20